jgi:chaperonin GroES
MVHPSKPAPKADQKPEPKAPDLYPRGNRALVRRLVAESATPGGLVIPDSAKEKSRRALVIAVGPGTVDPDTGRRVPLDLCAGDTVLMNAYAGAEIKYGGEEYVLVEDVDILALIGRNPAAAKA